MGGGRYRCYGVDGSYGQDGSYRAYGSYRAHGGDRADWKDRAYGGSDGKNRAYGFNRCHRTYGCCRGVSDGIDLWRHLCSQPCNRSLFV